jgi:NTE family protein
MRSQIRLIITTLFILIITGCASQQFPNLNIPKTEPTSARLKNFHPRVVLVLGSGSAKGFAHAGVLKVLEENHIPIDMIVGTSAGSIIGSLYADQPSADRLEKVLLTTRRDNVIDFSVLRIFNGAITGAALQNFLTRNMHATNFDQLKIPFIAVASDLQTGKVHAFSSGPIAPAVNASSAVAPLFRPVHIYGKTFVDGGFIDPVAVDVARSYHPKIIIAVKLDDKLPPEMPTNSAGTFLRGMDIMLLKLNEISVHNADVVISPKIESIEMFEEKNRGKIMEDGQEAAYKVLPEIKHLMIKDKIPFTS